MDPHSTSAASPRHGLAAGLLLVSLLAGLVAVSSESLWIDEANSALKATQPSLGTWLNVLRAEGGSDLQMPLYMLQLWAWEKLWGHSEFALRSINIIWFCLGQLAVVYALRRKPRALLIAGLLGATSPILWFYLNEARPYMMQYAGACVLCAVLMRAAEDPVSVFRQSALWTFGIGLVVLCSSSLLGVIWAGGAVATWCFLARSGWKSRERFPSVAPFLATGAALGLIAVYYVWTILVGGGASSVGKTGLLNLGFIAYELLGVAGLGPGRLEIRQVGFAAFRDLSFSLVIPVTAGIFAGTLLIYGVRLAARRPFRRMALAAITYTLPPALVLLALGYSQNFRLVGRHFVPVLPVVLGLLTLSIWHLWLTRRTIAICALAALSSAWLGSALSLRFLDRHRKDDYRGAAMAAKSALARNEIVWWSADRAAAIYYEVPIATHPSENGATLVFRPTRDELNGLPKPETVIASKPDIYDGRGNALDSYMLAHRFVPVRKLPAFTIWRRAAGP